jgi:tRNA(Ile)-lysidine synthase
MSLSKQVELVLRSHLGIALKDSFVLGVSGGADSMALLNEIVNQGYSPIVAHLNHNLRAKSEEDAKFVEGQAKSRKLSFVVNHIDINELAKGSQKNIEALSRRMRYEFLFSTAEESKAKAVLVGHHANDQIETLLMHLLRGSGPEGLAGMFSISTPNEWNQTIPLVRPLLPLFRSEIEDYCKLHNVEFVTDESNADTNFTRNAIRHELMPELEKFNPNVAEVLLTTQRILGDENQFLNSLVESNWTDIIIVREEHRLVIKRNSWEKLPLVIKRRMVRKIVQSLEVDLAKLDFRQIEILINWGQTSKVNDRLLWIADIEVLIEGNQIIFQQVGKNEMEVPQIQSTHMISLGEPISINLGLDWLFRGQANIASEKEIDFSQDRYSIACDLGKFEELQLRPRLPGDRFQPLGMTDGSMKLSDFMINEKIPERARENWPVLASENSILWIPGFQLAESVRVRPDSTRIHHLSIVQERN